NNEPEMAHPCTLLIPLILAAASHNAARPAGDCPRRCHCDEDGMLLRVDCSDLGLSALPANLSVFTSYLSDLSNAGLNQKTNCSTTANWCVFPCRMLQNNQLRQVPSEALQNLRNLQSLRLDANHISTVPQGCFDGLVSLRHLWLDDNALTEVPVSALGTLSSLQAMTLALNKITHIPDRAFANLSSLVVLHLNNNRVRSLGKQSFDGLQSLETLDLNYNSLEEFPMAIKSLSNLKELYFYDNPIQYFGRSAFQHLPELRTLSLNGAAEMTDFPDLSGTRSLESLTITGARITSLPAALCEQLPNLQILDLSYNLIQTLPSFRGCDKLQKIDLHHNSIHELQAATFQGLTSLRSLDLAWNQLGSVEPLSFSGLPVLTKLDLTSNELTTLPVEGLHGLTHLKLSGNEGLQELLMLENFPKLRVMEMPYAFQCCAFVSCDKVPIPWDREENSSNDFGRKDVMVSNQDHDLEDFLLDFDDEPKSHHSVQCSPAPGPFRPCLHLFGSWLIRGGVWLIALLSLFSNALLMVSIFLSPTYLSPARLLLGLLALANSLMGVWSATLAVVDALTFGNFASYGARWESSAGCKLAGFLSVFASETGIFLLTVAALERGLTVRCGGGKGAASGEGKASVGVVKLASALCFALGLGITFLPLVNLGGHSVSSLCLPLPLSEPSSLGFMVALVLVNSLCYLIMTVTYTRLYCRLEKGEPDNLWDCALIRHVAWLLFANCVLYFPVAFLSFSSLLRLPSVGPEVVKSVLLVVVPLPACLNPLLYILFNPHFREDMGLLLKSIRGALGGAPRLSLLSLDSEDAEKQSCDSTQALVTLSSSDESLGKSQMVQSTEAHRPPVPLVPCR
uniref:G-protein coupled receptors family 1 profile domain-containing protein n=1 Tax=Denticeps clupeoides TaxID=299321 RepID=A0AAY4BR77_9TELE